MERELLLLGLLRQSNMHGYQLNEFIEQNMSVCIDLKKPTAYALLDKMAQQGWIREFQTQSGNRPPRRTYQITEQGEQQFQRLLRENLAAHDTVRFPGDIGVAFLSELPAAEAILLLKQRRDALQTDLEAARAVPPHGGSLQLIIEHRLYHLETEIRWLDSLIDKLNRPSTESFGSSQMK